MPEVSRFYGIVITMYAKDHPPPHFHARYGEYAALIEIGTLGILDGWLPSRALELVLLWAQTHRVELAKNWQLLSDQQATFHKIEPLP